MNEAIELRRRENDPDAEQFANIMMPFSTFLNMEHFVTQKADTAPKAVTA